MSPNFFLSIPSPEKLRRRTTSLPEEHNRYVSVGGFVNIEHLTKRYEATKKPKQQYGLFGSVSPRPRASRASSSSEDVESQVWDSVPTTPCRNEGWNTSQTPETPFAGSKQTTHFHSRHQTIEFVTPPPVSKYNRYGHDLYLDASPRSAQFSEKNLLLSPPHSLTQVQAQSDQCTPVELAGSLLLPSQGFPQSNPPERPPHVHERSHSAPVALQPPRSLSITPDNVSSPATRNIPIVGRPSLPLMSAFDELEMTKQFHQRGASRSTPTLDQDNKSALPVRKSSLRSRMAPPQYRPPPIPLSRMKLEELMQILPTLDAAIIAHDWLPCMQKRHEELKETFQKMHRPPVLEPSLDFLNKQIETVFSQSHDMAKTYHKLFEIAKDLQSTDLQRKDADIDEANAQQSEAKIALARYISEHGETCESYERELEELKDMMRRTFEILGTFIEQHLGDVMASVPPQQTQQILAILKVGDKLRDLPVRYVSSDLYHDTHKALREANKEKHDLQEVCSEQMVTIRGQSRDLDQYVARMAKTIGMMQEKEHENRELAAQNKELELMAEAHKNAVRVDQQSKFDQEQFQRAVSGAHSMNSSVNNEIAGRDAEIANLRSKLEKAVIREKELQAQVRSLLQSSQHDSGLQRPSRLKRLLTGGPRGSPTSPTLPMTTSMLNLSNSIFTPFEKDRSPVVVPPSPPKSGKTSPSLASLCGPTVMDHLELPPPHINHSRASSSVEFGPRLREGVQYSLDRDVNSAVSSRFHHMPINVRSTASNSRPQTPSSNNDASYDVLSEYGRPRFNSAPEIPNLMSKPIQSARVEFDGQFPMNHQRVLSGITEVTEDTGSVKRRSSSPESDHKRVLLDSRRALRRLQDE